MLGRPAVGRRWTPVCCHWSRVGSLIQVVVAAVEREGTLWGRRRALLPLEELSVLIAVHPLRRPHQLQRLPLVRSL
jgi:hypothetical protein